MCHAIRMTTAGVQSFKVGDQVTVLMRSSTRKSPAIWAIGVVAGHPSIGIWEVRTDMGVRYAPSGLIRAEL